MEKQQSKQYEQLKKNINHLLKQFEKNREWADIGNWLARIQPVLAAKKYPDLPHKINLAKRLAQCLNANLPAGVHSGALNVYNTILNNFGNKKQLLPLLSIGLFPFFEYSSSSLKIEVIKIFETHYIKTPECIQMITSLMNTLLTGLNQNSEELSKKIFKLCDSISESYGRIWVDGAVWINILKSPKDRIAGFKYFNKSFKDRDKIRKKSVAENKEEEEKEDLTKIESNEESGEKNADKKIERKVSVSDANLLDSFSYEKEPGAELFHNLMEVRNWQDNNQTRFPNFSTLVVNAISACFQSADTDTLVRRSALDLMIFYLQLSNKELISEKDGVQLLLVMLQLLKMREYSLTRRVYTYLFGQPDMEGTYTIDTKQREYEISLLKIALKKLFRPIDSPSATRQYYEGNLKILQILLKDHDSLRIVLLPSSAFKLLSFLRVLNLSSKAVLQFYTNVIEPSSDIFLQAILHELTLDDVLQNGEVAHETVMTIDEYYTTRVKIQNFNIKQEEIQSVIEGMLRYMEKTSYVEEKVTVEMLQLCEKLLKYLPEDKNKLSAASIELLNKLISTRPPNSIYAELLILHPMPDKQTLLPYMYETSLSIVCISNLLQLDKEVFTKQEIESIFFATFKIINCHLWEDKAVSFIQDYRKKYPAQYSKLIDLVEPSEWLIYWRKMNGDVEGGVIRMLRNLEDENPLNRQLSKKWIENSKQIVSKIVDPIYKYMNENSSGQSVKDVYKMIQKVFEIQKKDFVTYFFLQKQRYFFPLVTTIFECLNGEDEDLKSSSIYMLQFLLERTNSLDEKIAFLSLTLKNTLELLQKIITTKTGYLKQIEIISYFRCMVDTFSAFEGHSEYVKILKKLIEDSEMYEIMSFGMKETTVPYVRTLYLDYIHESFEKLVKVIEDKTFIGGVATSVLEKLFVMLRENDVTYLEQIIRGQETSSVNRRKKSISNEKKPVSMTEFNVEAKYAQIIELWNSVKFFVNLSIENEIPDLPIAQLLSLILQSFPFSYLKFEQICEDLIKVEYENLQQEIRNVTGLKKEVLEIFDTLWSKFEEKIINFLIEKGDPRVLIHGNVDPSAVIKAMYKSAHCRKIAKYYKSIKFSLPKGTLHYNTEILLIQNQVNYFLYLYMSYCNLGLIKSKKVSTFVESALTLVKSINITSHVESKLWILQTLYCFSLRIPMKQLQADNLKLKGQFQDFIKELIDELTPVITKSRTFTHRVEMKSGLFNMFSKQEVQTSLFDFIKIFPPTIYTMEVRYQNLMKNKNSQHIIHIEDETEHILFSKWLNQDQQHFIQYLSVVTVKTYNKIFIPLLLKMYEQDYPKVSLIIKDHLNSLLAGMHDRSNQNQIYVETVSEFLLNVINSPGMKAEVIKLTKKQVIDIYMGNEFFKCTKNTLNFWKSIIDCYTENTDLLGEVLPKEGGLFDDIFTRKAEATRNKIKLFERVCFLIFAGRVDKYENKLRAVLESLNQVMKSEDPQPALLILILFCIRILIMRLSEDTLNRLFRTIWPTLITLLIQVFTKKTFSTKINLLLAGLKVIELVHALELEEFNIHKWLFIFDFFGLRLTTQTEEEQKITEDPKSILTPFKYKPILSRMLPESYFKCTFIPEPSIDQSSEVYRRKLIIKQSSIDSEEELQNHAFILLQYMMDLNQKRVFTARQDIQDIIEADFISLDDYIFQMK